MKKLILIVAVSLSTLILFGCAEPTPEELRAKQVTRYLGECEDVGMWSVAAQASPAQKYRDYLELAKWERDNMKAADPSLDEELCRAATAKGWKEGKKHEQRGAFN